MLPSYDDACRTLALLTDVFALKNIHNQALGIEQYAVAAKDPTLLADAVRIRFEAWRNIGRVIREMQERGELIASKGGRPKNPSGGERVKTISDLGLTWRQSSNAQWWLDCSEAERARRTQSIVDKMVRSLMTDILALAQFTAEEKHREALRELAMRKRVYPQLIAGGGLTAKEAARRMALMEAIAADYGKFAEQERLI
jgi:hypothetical protein